MMRYLMRYSTKLPGRFLTEVAVRADRDEVSYIVLPDGDLPIYSIGAVERMLGIPAATVRNWEERYGLVQPERSGGGHRLYTRAQIEQLRFVKERLDRGMQPAEAHRLLGEELEQGGDLRAADERDRAPRLLILLAERDPYAAEFAEFFLQTEGYEVVLALGADDAERLFEQRLPQLAVIELLISGGTGAELCQRLKEAGVSACLAISTLDARDQALAAGADAFLLKPLDPLRLVSTVKDLLGTSAFLQRATAR
jgi:DNA-binding transcriptional MerR regulator